MKNIFDSQLLIKYFPTILSGLPVTLEILVTVTVLALIIGTITALSRLFNIPVLKQLAVVIISYTRNTPIIIQLFIVYYALPVLLFAVFGINSNKWAPIIFVIITFSLHTSTFFSEAIKAGLKSIDKGQIEAAYSVGMTSLQAYSRIVCPQAFLIAFPTISISTCALLTDTAIAFTVGVLDVMGKATAIGGRTYHLLEAYIDAMVIFILVNFLLMLLFRTVEKRIKLFNGQKN